jgi:GNAT superfamily N-acetyltransferase
MTKDSGVRGVGAVAPGPDAALPARVVLADGRRALLRSLEPDDRAALLAFHEQLSAASIYWRYFSPHRRLSSQDLERALGSGPAGGLSIGAFVDDILVAQADWVPGADPEEAEVAFAVADAFQGHGLGTLLLERLAAIGRRRGIARLTAHVLPSNRRMMEVLTQVGFAEHASFADGVIRVVLETAESETHRRALARRASDV